ncbi:hypothetical protein DJ568_07805 [Mucilaginibacter hurinus]|uniref:TonB-dependent transporter Oar-like beta-barrel domain-containing protein n=1 Tax=Mucilaginibacter hurinus TaxID=2201324 RepID=A0A367GNN2_9SPHI|nr:carboxypeptidase regulatory-like domain-containing protein [Mucilaginibacter hurinus]RCH55087.1 hypothetical protein DJ568_07805 [Mucilaginibacter hurinus]
MKNRLLFILSFFFAINATAQVTTSSLTGTISDDSGGALAGATIKAKHQPSGTIYSSAANAAGRYTIPNMRVGGPYIIEVSFIGYAPLVVTDISIKLGELYPLDARLVQNNVNLNQINITGRKDIIMNSRHTGPSTSISRAQLEGLPTLSRSLQDFTRLTPQANGSSFMGASNRFNNITVDGAVNNDVFGLSQTGTPGGLAGTQPISLDAIQEIQVVLAPYDVSYGNFTGGGVNAITRSGNNEVHGSAYFFGKSQRLVGAGTLTNSRYPNFTDNQFGFRVGGPVVKNKLFFFINGELGRRDAPVAYNAGEAGAALSEEIAREITDFTLKKYGYDAGGYGGVNLQRQNNKVFIKLDWNITEKHQLALRHNYVSAFDEVLNRSGAYFSFGNNMYTIRNNQNVTVAELRSNFSDVFSNNLIIGYSVIRDRRQTAGELFPQIEIKNLNGVSSNSVFLGSDRSSVANVVNQDIFELTNNFKYFTGKHTFTIGTHNEFFRFDNVFVNNLNGRWDFASLADYCADKPERARATYSLTNVATPSARFNAVQLGFYVQDEFDAFQGFRLTLGLRADVPLISDKPAFNSRVTGSFPGVRTDRLPGGDVLWSPRVGFNYNITGDRAVQLRGGAGVFTGRVPFVWMANQFINNGMVLGTVDVRNNINGGNGLETDINKQKNVGGAVPTTEINAVDNNFRMPQVARFNLAADFKLPYGIIGTIEGIYSKTINNVSYRDINLKPSAASIDQTYSNGADTRPLYNISNKNKIDSSYTNVIYLENTNRGYTYSVTAQLQKTFDSGLNAVIAYTYGRSEDINSGISSTALSNWEYVQNVNGPNNLPLATSFYEVRHRIMASGGYKISYGRSKQFATGIALFYAGFSGTPYTYLYNGDLNGDGRFNNDLLFVPANSSQINLQDIVNSKTGAIIATAQQQWASLEKFIAEDPYLSKNKGRYAGRNEATTPWEHHVDIRITQDIGALVKGKKNALQLTLDVFNVGNLLNKNWGRSYFTASQAVSLISVTSSKGFNYSRTNSKGYDIADLASRWQGQLGIRYIFN